MLYLYCFISSFCKIYILHIFLSYDINTNVARKVQNE